MNKITLLITNLEALKKAVDQMTFKVSYRVMESYNEDFHVEFEYDSTAALFHLGQLYCTYKYTR
jgi:hypothetical protein